MKKNNNGFTLVELLAVIVILGILAVFSIPLITGMVDRSRNKVYVTDANKLISHAEYRIRTSNSDIEKPDPGDCIAISLVYLNSDDFDNPPNGGKYEKENSFVIIKNNNGKLEYSATLIEKIKGGGYKGVELTSSAELQSNNAVKHVKIFKKSDLMHIDVLNEDKAKARQYINGKLGKNYLTTSASVSAIYNYPYAGSSDDSSSEIIDSKPKIISSTISSTSNKRYNSFDATLTLKVVDSDTNLSNLTVCTSLKKGEEGTCSKYRTDASTKVFTKDFDFSKDHVYDGSSIDVYVKVTDGENKAEKTVTYTLHKNENPTIDKDNTIVTSGNDISGVSAIVKLFVSDDLDDITNLRYCVAETKTTDVGNACKNISNYKSYKDLFTGSDGGLATMEHTFTNCDNGCKRDGSTHYLTIFVIDSYAKDANSATSATFPYVFSTNRPPTINSLTVSSSSNKVPYEGNRNVLVGIDVSDDTTDLRSLKFKILENGTTNSKEYENDNNSGNKYFNFSLLSSDPYDGSEKTITVQVTDKDGGVSVGTVKYKLYENTAPVINGVDIYSDGEACDNDTICPISEGGSLNALVELSLYDDLDVANNYSNVKVCVSDDQAYCDKSYINSHYVSYSEYYNKKKSITLTGDYNGDAKTIYAYAIDTYGKISSVASASYQLYKDKSPIIEAFSVESETETFTDDGSLNIKYEIDASDDFENSTNLDFELLADEEVIVSGKLGEYLSKINRVKLPGKYDGRVVKLVAKVYDTNREETENNVIEYQYTIHQRELPTIESLEVNSAEKVCTKEGLCSGYDNNSINIEYSIDIGNALYEDDNELLVCVSETEECTNYTSISNYYNLSENKPIKKTFTFTPSDASKPYDGSTKTLYVYLKDPNYTNLDSNIISMAEPYTLYYNNAPMVMSHPDVKSNDQYGLNIPNIDFSVEALDDLDDNLSIKYCNYYNDSESCTAYRDFTSTVTLDNSFFNINSYSGQQFTIYAYVKDSYGVESRTGDVSYEIYQDSAPSIQSVSGAFDMVYYDANHNPVSSYDDAVTIEYTNFRVAFRATDYYDHYSYCVSDSDTECSNYSTTKFDGNSNELHIVTFNNLSVDGTSYLFLKDDNSNTSYIPFNAVEYRECDEGDELTNQYEYSFDPDKTYYEDEQPVTNNKKITIDLCEGKCYKRDDIVSYYDQNITYKDRFNSSVSCTKEGTNAITYKTSCNFKDCFYKNNNYQRYAIGTTRNDLFEEEFVFDNGSSQYNCTGYYHLYITDYTQGMEDITYSITPDRICAEAVDAGVYDYRSSDTNPYVRIRD